MPASIPKRCSRCCEAGDRLVTSVSESIMRALYWDGSEARLVERQPPQCESGSAVVRVSVAGVCDTDVQILRGYLGFRGVPGHEFVGTVDEGPPDWIGERVVGEINLACGRCDFCRRGLGRHCRDRQVMGIAGADGAFAEFLAIPVANLHAVPQGMTDETAVFTEPLAAALEILEQIHVRPGTQATVLGDGKLGLLVAQVLHRAGARVLAVGKHDAKLDILRHFGISTVLVKDWDRTPAELVVEATGSALGVEAAIAATRPRGTLVLKSTVADRVAIDLAPLVINEINVVGSRCGPFAAALRTLESGEIDVLSLIAARRPLAEAVDALRLAAQPGMLKVLIENT
jgi:threonine dehydrogenase-like Zn-dependent dehydrogenase